MTNKAEILDLNLYCSHRRNETTLQNSLETNYLRK